ncbi:MAG: protein kinase [Polyangiales bacterium]
MLGTPGRYEVGDVLAVGGMGAVHRAYDTLARRDIAYKRLRVSIEAHRARMTALFRREYDTLARLEHPNVVSVYDFGVDLQGPYYTMELVAGGDLAGRGVLPVREGCRILRDVASALALVHARRLIHRDVSPNNVRLTASSEAKLIDFGALASFGVPTEVVGTPPFIAPECLAGEPLDQRVDLYALGALGYYMLTRRLAVPAYDLEALAEAWLQPIAPPSSIVAEIPAALDDLIAALLHRDRAARPSTAGEVVERLTTIASLEPERDERRVAFSYLKHPPLQGRSDALSTFALSLDALMRGRGGAVMIEGGPGSGRSALLERLGIDAQLRGATVLRAQGTMHSAPLDAATHLARTGLAIYPELAQQHHERQSSAATEPRATGATEVAERYARQAAYIQDALLRVGLRSPLVLLVDDIELVDPQSVALLASLTNVLGRHAVLLACSRLVAPVTTDAEAVLLEEAKRVKLTPLSERDVAELVQTMFGGVPNSVRLARWLAAEGGGNPRRCIGLVGWLLDRGAARYARGTFTLPHDIELDASFESVEHLQVDRLARMGDGPLQLARLLALAGRALDLRQLAMASSTPASEVLEHLRLLAEESLVSEAEGSYALTNRSIGGILAGELSVAAQRPMHLALAAALGDAAATDPEQQIAAGMHLIRAGGDEALTGALRIENLARVHDYELAMSGNHLPPFSAALEVMKAHGYTDADCAHLLVMLSVSGFWGNLQAQRRYFDRAMRVLWRSTGLDVASRLRPWLGATLALLVGMLFGASRELLRRSRMPKWTFLRRMEGVVNTATTAVAAAACALDVIEAEHVVTWLEPLSPAPAGSALQISRQFALAVVDTSAGNLTRAVERYRNVLARTEQPLSDLVDTVRLQLRQGCLHGIAQASVEDRPEEALAAAEELSHSTFFAPHAELIRMFHHGLRGDRQRASEHRVRAEGLALLGGVSWSAVVLINIRAYGVASLTSDVLELVRASAEFERLAPLSPALAALDKLVHADLLRVRGRTQESLALYESVFATEVGRRLPSAAVHYGTYAQALLDAGRAEEARALCETLVGALPDDEGLIRSNHRIMLLQELALAEAAVGEHARAAARLEAMLAQLAATDNPLLLGALHRDRAAVALAARDVVAFDHHFGLMQTLFAATQNQWLIQQCDALLTRAVREGLKPTAPARALQAIAESSAEMDGATQIELREPSPSDRSGGDDTREVVPAAQGGGRGA